MSEGLKGGYNIGYKLVETSPMGHHKSPPIISYHKQSQKLYW